MGMGQAFFGFKGRLRRHEFLGLIIVSQLLVIAGAFIAGSMVSYRSLDTVFYVVLAVNAWMVGALAAKRLHDFSLPGWNAAWVAGLVIAANLAQYNRGDASTALGLAALAALLWLVFARGDEGKNMYGPAPELPY